MCTPSMTAIVTVVTVVAGDWPQGPMCMSSMTAMVTVVTEVASDWLQGSYVYTLYNCYGYCGY